MEIFKINVLFSNHFLGYFDKIAVVLNIKPIRVHIYSASANLIWSMTKKLKLIKDNLDFNKKVTQLDNSLPNLKAPSTEGPFYSVEYIFISEFHVKVYAMSSTNLNPVNFLPNLEMSIKVKFQPKSPSNFV